MQIRWKTVRVALLTMALGVGGVSVAAAVPASAATTPANASVHVASQLQSPKVPDPAVRYVTFIDSTGSEVAECFAGNEDSILAPEYVSNGCTTRVWLYQYRDETGYSLCLRPNSTTGHLGRSYHSFRIVSNSANC
jgi:hypothetical protein